MKSLGSPDTTVRSARTPPALAASTTTPKPWRRSGRGRVATRPKVRLCQVPDTAPLRVSWHRLDVPTAPAGGCARRQPIHWRRGAAGLGEGYAGTRAGPRVVEGLLELEPEELSTQHLWCSHEGRPPVVAQGPATDGIERAEPEPVPAAQLGDVDGPSGAFGQQQGRDRVVQQVHGPAVQLPGQLDATLDEVEVDDQRRRVLRLRAGQGR